jgi:peptidoglycan/xylan/chitin deacetylase (PgdA/CDA1 family)
VSKNTLSILKILDQENAKATFFIIGENLLEKKGGLSILQKIKDGGHVVANHTWSHRALTQLTEAQMADEVLTTQYGINSSYWKPPAGYYLRPPYGAINQVTYDKLSTVGFKVILWNLDTRDWEAKRSKQSIWSRYQASMNIANPQKDSFIILLHEREVTLALLPAMIFLAKEKGFNLVTIDTCTT